MCAAPEGRGNRWVYLGPGDPGRAAAHLGQTARDRLPLAIRKAEGALRGPYLDFMSQVERLQPSREAWHASTVAWRDPEASDFFFLICQLWALRDVVVAAEDGGAHVVADDPWIAEACRAIGVPPSRISTIRGRRRLLTLARGAAARTRWAWRMARARKTFGSPSSWPRLGAEVWIYSLYHPRCLAEGGRWRDPFLGDLDRLLEGEGARVGRLLPVGDIDDLEAVRQRRAYLRPQASGITLPGVATALLAAWRPRWPQDTTVAGIDVRRLLERAWWQDVGRAVWSSAVLFRRSMAELFERFPVSCVVYPYENQPWERMLVMAARAAGVRTVGYQHSTVPRLSLNYFFSDAGPDTAVLPDSILTTGPHQRDTLVGGGTPPERVKVGGSFRYRHLQGSLPDAARPRKDRRRVLVVTAHQLDSVVELDQAIRQAFPDGGAADSVEFWFRPHPTLALAGGDTGSWMRVLEGELAPQLQDFDALLCVGTTVAIEAFLMGIPVLRFLPEVAAEVDPADALPESQVPTADAKTLGPALRRLVAYPPAVPTDQRQASRDSLFPPVDVPTWCEVVLWGGDDL